MNKVRLIWSLLGWGFSAPLVWISFGSVRFLAEGNVAGPFIYIFPWVALFAMTIGWIKNQRVNKIWPVSGTLVALPALFTALPLLLLRPMSLIPGIVLAIWLVEFHLKVGLYNERSESGR